MPSASIVKSLLERRESGAFSARTVIATLGIRKNAKKKGKKRNRKMEYRGTVFYSDAHAKLWLSIGQRYINVYLYDDAYVFGSAHRKRDTADSFLVPRYQKKQPLYRIVVRIKKSAKYASKLNEKENEKCPD